MGRTTTTTKGEEKKISKAVSFTTIKTNLPNCSPILQRQFKELVSTVTG